MVHFNKIGRPGVSRADMKFAVTLAQQKRVDEEVKKREQEREERERMEREQAEAQRVYNLPENVRDRELSDMDEDLELALARVSFGVDVDPNKLAEYVLKLVRIVREMNEK